MMNLLQSHMQSTQLFVFHLVVETTRLRIKVAVLVVSQMPWNQLLIVHSYTNNGIPCLPGSSFSFIMISHVRIDPNPGSEL